MSAPAAGITVRRATPDDLPRVFAVAQRALGWAPGPATEAHFAWKHSENPFGPSPMWVAEAGGRLAGYRTFLRWELATASGEVRRVVRAVDTATDPDFRGRGVFTRLTLGALDELADDGVDFVFNTPNAQSRPGYLKMGWHTVGRLPVGIRPTGPRGLTRIARARTPADRGAVPTAAGTAAAEFFTDATVAAALLAGSPRPPGLATPRTRAYLEWRYRPESLHYRVVTGADGPAAGVVVFHLRRRGPAVEAVVCELMVPREDPATARRLLGRVARETGADYVIRLRLPGERPGSLRFAPIPRVGPVLTARAITTPPPEALPGWHLELGDIELF